MNYYQKACDNCAHDIKRRYYFKTAHILYTFCSKACRDLFIHERGLVYAMKDYAERFRQIQARQRAIEAADIADGANERVGSNAPLATQLITDIFKEFDQPSTATDIFCLARSKGFNGPFGRIQTALLRLIETGFLERSGNRYTRAKGGQQ